MAAQQKVSDAIRRRLQKVAQQSPGGDEAHCAELLSATTVAIWILLGFYKAYSQAREEHPSFLANTDGKPF